MVDTVAASISPLVADLRSAVDALVASDPACFADGESVVALTTELARLDAVACRQAEAFVGVGDWDLAGAQSAPAWVATRCRVPKRVARQRLRLGRFCLRYEVVAAAFAAGTISIDHVEVLSGACNRNRFTRRAFNDNEATLVGWAASMPFEDFRHASVDLTRSSSNGRRLCRFHNNARNRALEQRVRDRVATALAQTRPPPDNPDP